MTPMPGRRVVTIILVLLGPLAGGCGDDASIGDEQVSAAPYRLTNFEAGPSDIVLSSSAEAPDGTLYFRADDKRNGSQVWRTDGTAGGTRRVTSLGGADGCNPRRFTWVGRNLLFTAIDAEHGEEWWRTDGTPAGTVLVAETQPGPAFERIGNYGSIGSSLVFQVIPSLRADRSGVVGLMSIDGTAEGTRVVGDLGLHYFGGSHPPVGGPGIQVGGTWWFDFGANAWRTDGTTSGTSIFFTPLYRYSATVTQFVSMGPHVYFLRTSTGDSDALWRTNGTREGTLLVSDVAGRVIADSLVIAGDHLYFRVGGEMWQSDGTEEGTMLATGIVDRGPLVPMVGMGTSLIAHGAFALYRFDDRLGAPVRLASGFQSFAESRATTSRTYFIASDAEHGQRLWITDGTTEGTVILPGAELLQGPRGLEVAGSRLYFSADDGTNGRELWAVPLRP